MIEYEYSSMLRSLDRDLSTGQVRVYKSVAPRHTMFILSTLELQITARKAKIFIICSNSSLHTGLLIVTNLAREMFRHNKKYNFHNWHLINLFKKIV